MTSFATAMHIVVFGILRLISIRRPHFFNRISNKAGIVSRLYKRMTLDDWVSVSVFGE